MDVHPGWQLNSWCWYHYPQETLTPQYKFWGQKDLHYWENYNNPRLIYIVPKPVELEKTNFKVYFLTKIIRFFTSKCFFIAIYLRAPIFFYPKLRYNSSLFSLMCRFHFFFVFFSRSNACVVDTTLVHNGFKENCGVPFKFLKSNWLS